MPTCQWNFLERNYNVNEKYILKYILVYHCDTIYDLKDKKEGFYLNKKSRKYFKEKKYKARS